MKVLKVSSILVFTMCIAVAAWAQDNVLVMQNSRELFVDDAVLESTEKMEQRLGTPVSAGKVFSFDKPWEGKYCGYGSVIFDGKRYRMYYRGMPDDKKNTPQVTAYAESNDGINWQKPDLGVYTVNGTRKNNVVLMDGKNLVTHNFSVTYDGRDGVPAEERYKAIGGKEASGVIRYVSADGIHWKAYKPDEPLFKGLAPALDSQNIIAWVPSDNGYAIYLRLWVGRDKAKNQDGLRMVARSFSKNFDHWSEPEVMTFDEPQTEHLYSNATQSYFRAPQILIALPFRFAFTPVLTDAEFHQSGIDPSHWDGISDGLFMTSRGGTRYDRKFKESFVRPGLGLEDWGGHGNMPVAGVVPTGVGEMSFYMIRAYGSKMAYIERMVLRADGFASLHAGFSDGSATTKPLILKGNELSVNFSTSIAGYIKVTMLDEDRQEIPGFGASDAEKILGNRIDGKIKWKSGKTIRDLGGRKVRIRFLAKDADIYSFAVSD